MAVISFTLNLPVVYTTEDGWIVASFPDIDVSSQGRTEAEAARNLIEAAQLFVESCFERGVLEEVLKGCGFTLARGTAQKRPENTPHLQVPIELVAAHDGSTAHAG